MFSSVFAVSRSTILPVLFGISVLLGLSACASSDVSSINAASQEQLQGIRISEITVTMATAKPNPNLQAALQEELDKAIPLCATGDADHRLDVTVSDFEEQDVGKAIFLGDKIELERRAEFVHLATGLQTGADYVENSLAGRIHRRRDDVRRREVTERRFCRADLHGSLRERPHGTAQGARLTTSFTDATRA